MSVSSCMRSTSPVFRAVQTHEACAGRLCASGKKSCGTSSLAARFDGRRSRVIARLDLQRIQEGERVFLTFAAAEDPAAGPSAGDYAR